MVTVPVSAPDERIAVLPAALADQIAAGEVVERPGSIVKELLDNAVDAGARRIELELEGGGSERIRLIDDGRGILREDLELAITRHATSKLRRPEQLVEILTLGFRGEALASIAAVARVDIRSRPRGEVVGHRLRSAPGERPQIEPVGMPEGTQVEVEHLFANVPARRKFLRSEATEVGHCVDAVIRVALVHPEVHFRVRHGQRELLDLASGDQHGRVLALLQRRGGHGPFVAFEDEREGVRVRAWFGPPEAATRQRNTSFVVVRRRVVRERTLAAILKQAYGEALPRGHHPLACLFVDPPRGTVDVNVHPQKSEVRFAEAQTVYASVRAVVEAGLAEASWRGPSPAPGDPGSTMAGRGGFGLERAADHGERTRASLAGWSRREALGASLPARDEGSGGGRASGAGRYSLGTRAAGRDYAADKRAFRGEVDRLRARNANDPRPPRAPDPGSAPTLFDTRGEEPRVDAASQVDPALEAEPTPQLLTCLPGPVALFEFEGQLLAADLRRVRADLVRRRLLLEWAASADDQRAPGQRLLEPVVVRRRPEERERLLRFAAELERLGLEIEGFGDDALIVRAVPAALPEVLDAAEVGLLLHRLLPYLALRERARQPTHDDGAREGLAHALGELAGARGVDTSPRLARRWIAELFELHPGRALAEVPGVRLWSPRVLVGDEDSSGGRGEPSR